MLWRVVHFIDEDSVEAVPLFWIENDMCFWPPWSGSKLKNAIKKCETPCKQSWNLYAIRLIGPTYSDLETARLKAIRAEATSDVNSDAVGKRISKKKVYPGFQSESSSDANSDIEGKTTSTKFNSGFHGESTLNESQEDTDEEVVQLPVLHTTPTSQQIGDGQPYRKKSFAASSQIMTEGVHSTPPQITTLDPMFKNQVLRLLHKLDLKLDQIQEDLADLKSRTVATEPKKPHEKIVDKFNFPLKENKDLMELEQFLSIKENRDTFIVELARIGGSTYKIMVKRIMEKLFTNELMNHYSWIGFKKKQVFSSLHIASIITAAVASIHKQTLADVEQATKIWLSKCKERLTTAQKQINQN